MPKNLILLTGAGFTYNFGGFLAREMWSKIFNNPLVQSSKPLRELLQKDFDFESVYFNVMAGAYNNEDKQSLKRSVEDAYGDLDQAIKNWNFRTDNPTALNTYGIGELLSLVSQKGSNQGCFFTLNQDLFMERTRNYRSPGASFPQHFVDRSTLQLPSEQELEKVKTTLNNTSYIKLHGSYGWSSSNGNIQMVIGKNKVEDINREPLLKWYFEIFENVIKEGNKKLLIIGYGFGDVHINDILLKGVEEYGLSLYVINPTDPEAFKNILEGRPNHSGSWEQSKYYKIWSGIKGYFPYTLRQIFPPDQSTTTTWLEIKRALEN